MDDHLIKKGDRIFWAMKDGAYAPGRILEMRKKSGPSNASAYAILKLASTIIDTLYCLFLRF